MKPITPSEAAKRSKRELKFLFRQAAEGIAQGEARARQARAAAKSIQRELARRREP